MSTQEKVQARIIAECQRNPNGGFADNARTAAVAGAAEARAMGWPEKPVYATVVYFAKVAADMAAQVYESVAAVDAECVR